MACESPYRLPACAIAACDTGSAAERLRPSVGAKFRSKTAAAKRSEMRSAEKRATFAVANETRPSSKSVGTRVSSRQAALIAREEEMAALCQRRAARWADAIREGLDPDIARVIRDQAAAWRVLATSYARSAGEAATKPAAPR